MTTKNFDKFLKALPGTQSQIMRKTGLSASTVSRLARLAQAAGFAHIGKFNRSTEARGPQHAYYVKGPGVDAVRPRLPHSPKHHKRPPVARDPSKAALLSSRLSV